MLVLALALQSAVVAPNSRPPVTPVRPAERLSIEHSPRDWSATLRIDAQALHDEIAANHPGPVNKADPGFTARNDAQLALALKRARTARTYSDYFFALRGYVASFDDGHMGFGAFGATPWDGAAWPGFLTAYDGSGVQRVMTRADDAPVPLGAELLGCDGQSAGKIIERVLAPQWGRWSLEAQREAFGASLFASEGNPYVPRPVRCSFMADGQRRDIVLAWRPIGAGALIQREREARSSVTYTFASRVLPNRIRWFSIPSFNGDPGSTAGKALPGMIGAMKADRAVLVGAPAIVLDLRGNGGGSSDWSRQIAEALWEPAAVKALPDDHSFAEWRVSPANLARLEQSYAERHGKGMSAEGERWFTTTIAGLRMALARHNTLWRNADDDGGAGPENKENPPKSSVPLRGPVYVLTDRSCGSACLDAVDLWTSLGAVVVGRTTSADTLYMDVRSYRLPSGITGGGMPMKVYRGRSRGANVPVVPHYHFDGNITDTPALESWIATLPSQSDTRVAAVPAN